MPTDNHPKPSLARTVQDHKGLLVFGLVLVILLTTSLLLRSIASKLPTTNSSEWSELEVDQVVEDLSYLEKQATNKTSDGRSTTYSFRSEYPAFPHSVIIDNRSNKVVETKKMLPPDTNETISGYSEKLGEPDLILFHTPTGGSVRAHVYLSEGLVIIAHVDGGVVEEFWQILPTTEEVFMARYGDQFSTLHPGQERFDDQVEDGVGIEPDFSL